MNFEAMERMRITECEAMKGNGKYGQKAFSLFTFHLTIKISGKLCI